MSGEVVHLQPDVHRALQELLPWYASGALDAAEAGRVEQHVAGCAHCQAELEFERRLLARMNALPLANEPDSEAVERGLARLRRRIDDAPAPARAAPARALPVSWPRWAVAAQFAVIAGLVALLLMPAERYRALGDTAAPADPAAQVVVRFRADASEHDIRQALTASGARIVNGPTSTGAYVLAVPAAHADQAVATLRAQAAVALAESLEAASPR